MAALDATPDQSVEVIAGDEVAVAGPLAADPSALGLPCFIVGAVALGIFAGFWLSYFLLVSGLIRAWFAIPLTAIASTQELFLISWLVIVVMLTLATLRLPAAFTAVFVLVALTVLLVLIGTEQASAGLAKAGGYALLLAALGGVYLFFNSLSIATGGKEMPLGRPILHG